MFFDRNRLSTRIRAGSHQAAVCCHRKSKSSAPALSIARANHFTLLEMLCAAGGYFWPIVRIQP
jgi:hypothetical protein